MADVARRKSDGKKEDGGIHVDGICLLGYDTQAEAQDVVNNSPALRKKGAQAICLNGKPERLLHALKKYSNLSAWIIKRLGR